MSLPPLDEVTVGWPPAETPLITTAPVTDPQVGGSGLLPTGNSDDVRLLVNGLVVSGWENVAVTRGMESVPSIFDIALTERYPTDPTTTDITAGASCQL